MLIAAIEMFADFMGGQSFDGGRRWE